MVTVHHTNVGHAATVRLTAANATARNTNDDADADAAAALASATGATVHDLQIL